MGSFTANLSEAEKAELMRRNREQQEREIEQRRVAESVRLREAEERATKQADLFRQNGWMYRDNEEWSKQIMGYEVFIHGEVYGIEDYYLSHTAYTMNVEIDNGDTVILSLREDFSDIVEKEAKLRRVLGGYNA